MDSVSVRFDSRRLIERSRVFCAQCGAGAGRFSGGLSLTLEVDGTHADIKGTIASAAAAGSWLSVLQAGHRNHTAVPFECKQEDTLISGGANFTLPSLGKSGDCFAAALKKAGVVSVSVSVSALVLALAVVVVLLFWSVFSVLVLALVDESFA